MNQKILVVFANQYEMDDVKGTSVHYFFLNEKGQIEVQHGTEGAIGQQRAKVSLAYADREKISRVPAVYDGTFVMSTGSDGKPVLKLCDLVLDPMTALASIFPAEKK